MIISGTELSRQTATVLDLVENGRVCLVLRNNKPVAVMFPFSQDAVKDMQWETLDKVLEDNSNRMENEDED